MAWIFFCSAFEIDVTNAKQAAEAMNKMRSDFIFYKRAYEDDSQNPLWEYMLEFFVARYTEKAKEALNTETLDPQLSYSIRFYCYGGIGMTKEWLLSDNITPAESVIKMMFLSMPANLRTIMTDVPDEFATT